LNLPVAEREHVWVKVAESVEAAFKGRKLEDGWVVANERRVLDSLIGLVQNGGDDSFLIISTRDYYVQFLYIPNEDILLCETISDAYLPETSKLSNESIDQLLAMGFDKPSDDRSNFCRDYTLDKELSILPEISAMVVRVLLEVYRVSQNCKLEFIKGYPA
jgi:hypothetical protein